MKIKTNVKVGAVHTNHNQAAARSLKVRSGVRAGGVKANHNQTVARGLEVQTRKKLRTNRAWLKMTLSFLAVALVALTVVKASAVSPRAQLDPGFFNIFQNGIRVGEIYVPERDPGASRYVEHWILYNSYVYPSRELPELKTEIRVSQKSAYESEADFFARAPFGPGFRYVRADCAEFDRLPGR
jgi:hypothetical protein